MTDYPWLPKGLQPGDKVVVTFESYECTVRNVDIVGGRWAVSDLKVDSPNMGGHRGFYLERDCPGRTVRRVDNPDET